MWSCMVHTVLPVFSDICGWIITPLFPIQLDSMKQTDSFPLSGVFSVYPTTSGAWNGSGGAGSSRAAETGIFCVHLSFHTTSVVWNLRWTQKIPSLMLNPGFTQNFWGWWAAGEVIMVSNVVSSWYNIPHYHEVLLNEVTSGGDAKGIIQICIMARIIRVCEIKLQIKCPRDGC